MAVNKALISPQLLLKLNDENEELRGRLQLAETVFSSPIIPAVRKEEIIFEWLANVIKDVGCEGSSEPYEVLTRCVNGPRLPGLTMELRRNIVVSLIEALTSPLCKEDTEVEGKRKECIISVLSSQYFLNMFYRDVTSLSKLVGEYYACSKSTSPSSAELKKVANVISKFSKVCLLHEDLRFIFINEMMIPLCSILSKITEDYEECEGEVFDCMLQILFRESNLTEKFIELSNVKKISEDTSFSATLIHILRKLPKAQDVGVVKIVFSLFLKAILRSNKDNHSQVFKVFTSLCVILGVKVKGMVSIDQKPLKKWTSEESYIVISSMVQLMDEMNLSIDCIIENDVTLQIWFTSMIIGLANINSGSLSPEFLKMITSVLKFNPMVIESAHKPLCTQIILASKGDENVKKEYVCMLKTLLSGSLQVRRLQKFISKFLSCVEEHLQFSDEFDYGIEDIFPAEITDHFCSSVSMMPGSQVLNTTKSLQYHLHYLCSNKLSVSCSGSNAILSTEIVTHLLNLFLRGVKIADFNTPTVVKDKFSSIVMEIGESLEKFAEVLIVESKPDDRLLSCFLKLCYSVGASILLMWEYDRDTRRPLEEMDNIPTNLSYIHSYIDDMAWEGIAKCVHFCESDVVKNNFYLLIMQKMTAVSQIESGDDGPGTQAARYLLANASPSWHWDNATVLAPLLQDNELLGLLEGLIKSAGLDHSKWIPFVSTDYFSRNKRLVVATSTGMLTAVARHIHKNRKNGAVSHRVMSKVAVVPLLQYELSRLYEENEELECDLRCFFEEMIAELEGYLLEEPDPACTNEDYSIGGFIEIITKIPYEDCSYALEVCMLIAIIALLCDIPIGTNNDYLLLDKLNAFLREPKMSIPGFLLNLHSGALLRFLVKRSDHFRSQRLLIQRFCNFSVTSSYSNHILIKYVKCPSPSTLWQTSAVIQALSENTKGPMVEANRGKSLMKLLNAAIPLLEKETPCMTLLPDYFVTLKQLCKINDYPLLTRLFKNFQQYVNLAITNYEYGKPLLKLVLKRRALLSSEFPSLFLTDMWEKVFLVHDLDDASVFLNFCSYLSVEEISTILTKMYYLMDDSLKEKPINKMKIKRCLNLWKTAIWADVGASQRKEVGTALNTFMGPLLKLVETWASEPCPIILPVLDLLTEMAQCTSLSNFGSQLLDMYFLVLSEVPLQGNQILDNLNGGFDALIALFMFRRTLMVDRLPPFLQIFRKYLKALGSISAEDLEEPTLFNTTLCADRISRGTEIMIKYKKDFGRVAPYMISDILSIFEANVLHPDVKVHFVNTLCSFISIMDEHGHAYLANSLNPASQELLKTYMDEYNRHYKYHGKI